MLFCVFYETIVMQIFLNIFNSISDKFLILKKEVNNRFFLIFKNALLILKYIILEIYVSRTCALE